VNTLDTIIIGAGHNGLVAAAYLAKRGKKVLVLERREVLGGQVVTESFGDGFTVDSLHAGGTLRSEIFRDLNLGSFGLRMDAARKPFISLQAASDHLVFDPDPLEAAESIKRFSADDAAAWPGFVAFMKKAMRFIHKADATIMPRLPQNLSRSEGMGLAGLGIDVRRMSGQDMMRIIRGIPMTAENSWMSGSIRGGQGRGRVLGIHGFTLGVMGADRLHPDAQLDQSRRDVARPRRGAWARSASVGRRGQVIRRRDPGRAEVVGIQVDKYTCKGVVLANGEEISAGTVVSAVDPKRTFLSLVGPMNLPPEFVWHVQSIKMRGSVAKIHLLTDGKHGIPDGTVALAPSLKYLEHAYDAAKYHEISENPISGDDRGMVSIHFQFAPYELRRVSEPFDGLTVRAGSPHAGARRQGRRR
jgi:hypothetical protein